MYYLEECGEVDNGRKRLILYIFSLPTLVKNPSCCRVEGFGSISSFTKRVYICMFLCFCVLLIYVCVRPQLLSIIFVFRCRGCVLLLCLGLCAFLLAGSVWQQSGW